MRAVVRIAVRQSLRRPWQPLLAILAVTLGTAVLAGVDVAGASASAAFDSAVDSLAGRATHRIAGGPSGVDERLFVALRQRGHRSATPTVEGHCRLIEGGQRGRALRLVGVDPFSELSVRPWFAFRVGDTARFDAARLAAEPNTALVLAATAARSGLEVEGAIALDVRGIRRELRVIGLLEPDDEVARRGLDDVVVCDVSTAQEVLGEIGRLDRIDLTLTAAAERQLRRELPALPGYDSTLRIESAAAERGELDRITAAFRANLRALGLLALLVGGLLVYNAMQLQVVRRRELIGVLRSIGASRGQLFGAVLAEAAVLGVVGSACGILLGHVLASELLEAVGRTIGEMYVAVGVHDVALAPGTILLASTLGVLVSVVAGLAPAIEATAVPARAAVIRSDLETRARRVTNRAAWVGCGLLALGVATAEIPGVVAGYAAGLLVLLGAASTAPVLTVLILRVVRRPVGALLGTAGRYAVRSATDGLSRTGVAVAALMLAVSATIGLGVMIQSFRLSVESWLDRALIADVYASPPTAIAARTESWLSAETLERLLAVDGVAASSTVRRVDLETDRGVVEIAAVTPGPTAMRTFPWLEGDPAAAVRGLQGAEVVSISEPLQSRLGLSVGDSLVLTTPDGEREVEVVATFRDYSVDRGYAVLGRAAYDRWFDDRRVASVGLWADAGVDPDELLERVRTATASLDQEVVARSNRALRDASLVVFDRTFAITAVLRTLYALVAFVGMVGALAALQLERSRETAVLRAIGAEPKQVAQWVITENTLLGVCAGLLAVPTGLALGWLLVHVISRRSFGWTLEHFVIPPSSLVEAGLTAILAAFLSALWPAWRLARTNVAAGLREE